MKKGDQKMQILIVNNDKALNNSWRRHFAPKFPSITLAFAETILDAKTIFRSTLDPTHPLGGSLDLVIMNAFTTDHSKAPKTLDLIRWMREQFKGTIVGVSTEPSYRGEFMAAGCTAAMDKTKENLESLLDMMVKTTNAVRDAQALFPQKAPKGSQ